MCYNKDTNKRKEMKNMLIWTIEELYNWAKENQIEDFTVFTCDEGCNTHIYVEEIQIDKENKTIKL